MKTTLLIDDDLVAAAKELDLNMSAIARDAIAKRVAEHKAAHGDEMRLCNAFQDGLPVSFWGRYVATHVITDHHAYITEKGAIVITSDINAQGDDGIDSISDSFDAFLNMVAESHRNNPRAERFPKEDQEFLEAIAKAAGVPYRRHLDI